MSEELIYLYRRKGHEAWATCDADRYAELSGNHFFEVRVARHQHDYAALEAECDALRQQLADVFKGNTKLHVLWTEAVQQRDKLAGLLWEARSAYTTATNWKGMRATMAKIDAALSELTP